MLLRFARICILFGLLLPILLGHTRLRHRHRVYHASLSGAHITAERHGKAPGIRIHIAGGPWVSPTFADSSIDDHTAGDDPLVRYAAVNALGPFNGSVVVIDPDTGRVLTIVNQKLALSGGFEPCSTIKLVTGLAGLSEDVIHAGPLERAGIRGGDSLTRAYQHSSNRYFAAVGINLGFDRFVHYARAFGVGERAGLNIAGETPGTLPDAPPSPEDGGIGMMTSFGRGISITPLELAALTGAIANGGTLYYLQYPTTQKELEHFTPKVKRHLQIDAYDSAIKAGMSAVVELGTGKRANEGPENPIFGKTGTCTDARYATHLGWFASFNQGPQRSIVVVVLLTGGQPVNGPFAASVAGAVYKTLQEDDYFGTKAVPLNRAALR